MNSNNIFFTVINKLFVPQAYCLIKSLKKYNHKIIIISFDKGIDKYFKNFSNTKVIYYDEILPKNIRKKFPDRSIAEFISTITPSIFLILLNKYRDNMITYVDADVSFFDNPKKILEKLIKNKEKSILITKHNFEQKYESSKKTGNFCVQFISCKNNQYSKIVLNEWSKNCIEWCYYKYENDKFGDQKYLDNWPLKYPKKILILDNLNFSVAPWNINICNLNEMVFFHFHSLRLIDKERVLLHFGFDINKKQIKMIYHPYVTNLSEIVRLLDFVPKQFTQEPLPILIVKSIKFFFLKLIFLNNKKLPYFNLAIRKI